MKLIIDIPEEYYKNDNLIHFFGCYSEKLDEVFKNGVPLEDIKSDIKAIQKEDLECDGCSDMGMVLDIIDEHIGG